MDKRRLFIGDLHGCLGELESLLRRFDYRSGVDQICSVGDIVGRGPDIVGCLELLKREKALLVAGNHEAFLLEAAETPLAKRTPRQNAYVESLGETADEWVKWIGQWPLYLEFVDVFLVHAGLEPGIEHPKNMRPHVLQRIRTWDGIGQKLHVEEDPPWFVCQTWPKTVVFGHWAQLGLIDLPGFKGLDTGCVYGRQLTGWCPEENRFIHVPAGRAWAEVHLSQA